MSQVSSSALPRSLVLFLRACLFLLALAMLASFVFLTPHWGLMDDAYLLSSVIPKMDARGILAEAWSFALNDLIWGMFRPVYPVMAYLLYKPGLLAAPWVTFALNAALVTGLLWGLARVLSRALHLPWLPVFAANTAYIYHYDLFQHPSLQEKLLLLFGWLMILSAERAPRRGLFLFCALASVLGFLSKTSFLVYYAVGFLFFLGRLREELLAKRTRAWLEAAGMGGIGIVAVFLLAAVARKGGYTAPDYSLAKILPNMRSAVFFLLIVPVLLAAFELVQRPRRILEAPAEYAPAAGVCVFLLIFLPWGLSGYIPALVGPLFSVQLVRGVFRWASPRARNLSIAGVACLGLLAGAYRFPGMFLRLHDLGEIVRRWDELGAGVSALKMPCMEGADSLRTFLKQEAKRDLAVVYHPGLPEPGAGSGVWLYDSAMCAFPGRLLDPPGCHQQVLFQSVWSRSYRLVKLDCGG